MGNVSAKDFAMGCCACYANNLLRNRCVPVGVPVSVCVCVQLCILVDRRRHNCQSNLLMARQAPSQPSLCCCSAAAAVIVVSAACVVVNVLALFIAKVPCGKQIGPCSLKFD